MLLADNIAKFLEQLRVVFLEDFNILRQLIINPRTHTRDGLHPLRV
ncbi:hypothetical protein [Natrinema sp. HArc-T2]